ncbi:hypothetical protein [Magnetovibrio sp.]|uniref:hypothetical protein n=1 Tax=Magnetovibrio sp. TaxID=2024836 RepID=UPI002F9369AC
MALERLTLLENAVDSLNEALRKYNEGIDGDTKSYKFAITHFSHFIELMFKYYVSKSHPLLIYKNPYSKSLETSRGRKDATTIGLWEAVQFLKNEGKPIQEEFKQDMEWLKKLRNKIEHHEFKMDTREVRLTLGRLVRAFIDFNESHSTLNFDEKIDVMRYPAFVSLADEYKSRLENARATATEENDDDSNYNCPHCGATDTVSLSGDLFTCHLCDQTESAITCRECSAIISETDAVDLDIDQHSPDPIYVCESCYDKMCYEE